MFELHELGMWVMGIVLGGLLVGIIMIQIIYSTKLWVNDEEQEVLENFRIRVLGIDIRHLDAFYFAAFVF